MKCPSCSHEFGYLHLPEVGGEGKVEFHCPNCNVLLNANPLLKITRKFRVYLYAGFIISMLVAVINYAVYGATMPLWLGVLVILNSVGFLGAAFWEDRKINDELRYEKVASE